MKNMKSLVIDEISFVQNPLHVTLIPILEGKQQSLRISGKKG